LAATFHLGAEELRRHQVNWMAKWAVLSRGLFQEMDVGGTTKGPKGRISGGPDDKCGQGNGARLESKPGEAHKTHITHGIQAF